MLYNFFLFPSSLVHLFSTLFQFTVDLTEKYREQERYRATRVFALPHILLSLFLFLIFNAYITYTLKHINLKKKEPKSLRHRKKIKQRNMKIFWGDKRREKMRNCIHAVKIPYTFDACVCVCVHVLFNYTLAIALR